MSERKLGSILDIVDGTYVNIKASSIDEFAYVNRKQQHSINCQVVANSDYYIRDLVTKWPEGTDESFMWKQSSAR